MINCKKCGKKCDFLIKVEEIATTLKWNGKTYAEGTSKKNRKYFCPTCKIEIPEEIVKKFLVQL